MKDASDEFSDYAFSVPYSAKPPTLQMAVTQGVLRVDCDPYGDARGDLCSPIPSRLPSPNTGGSGRRRL